MTTADAVARANQPPLSAEFIEKYRRDGYFTIENLFDQDEIRRLSAASDEFVETSRSLTESDKVYDLGEGHSAERPHLRRVTRPHLNNAEYGRLIRSPKILNVAHALLGPNLRLGSSKINLKLAGYGAPVEWHQDWAFYPHTNEDILAVGIMLDDCELDNAPMMILPGSHRGPIYDHHAEGRFAGAIDPERSGIDFSKTVPFLGKAGSMTVHHVRAVHGSAPNWSKKDRRLIILAYRAADAWPLLGFTGGASDEADLETFDRMMVAGVPTLEPRMQTLPVRMPLPRAVSPRGIFEIQRGARNAFFK